MSFYIVPVLLPALFVDILMTIGLFQKRKTRRLYLWAAAFVATPLYFMSAIAWVIFYVGDPRFQRFGSLGLMIFFWLGVVFSVFRFLLGVLLLLRHS